MKTRRFSLTLTSCLALAWMAAPLHAGAIEVYTTILEGDPNQPGQELVVRVGVRDNPLHVIGSYALLVRWTQGALEPRASQFATPVDDGFFNSPQRSAIGQDQVVVTSIYPTFFWADFRADFREGGLFDLHFQTLPQVEDMSYRVVVEPRGPTPLISGLPYTTLEFTIDTSQTEGLGQGPEGALPSVIPFAEYPGDVDEDGILSPPEMRFPSVGESSSLLADSDGDGLADGVEDSNQNGSQDEGETSTRDADSDGDGLEDGIEVLILGSDPLDANSPGFYTDADGDGLPASHDPDDGNPDTDGDLFLDGYEAAHLGLAAVTDAEQYPPLMDLMGQGAPSFGGTFIHPIYALLFDNVAPGGLFDFRRADVNRDGFVTNFDALAGSSYNFLAQLPTLYLPYGMLKSPDTDRDMVPDSVEGANAFLPAGVSNMLLVDSDGDGVRDGEEDANQNGIQDPGETSARNADSDGDGLEDGIEIYVLNSDPLDPSSPGAFTDADGDGLPASHDPDDANPDVDGDGIDDGYEAVFDAGGLANVTDPNATPPLGDLNLDGAVTNFDALLIQGAFLSLAHSEDFPGITFGDVNRDGSVTNLDALITQAFFLGSVLHLPLR